MSSQAHKPQTSRIRLPAVFRRRVPPTVAGPWLLGRRRVYILPTRAGMLYAMTLIAMLIGSVNYNLGLGYVLTFLLAGLAVVAMLHTHYNLVQVSVEHGRAESAFKGGSVEYQLIVRNPSARMRHAIALRAAGQRSVFIDVEGQNSTVANLRMPAHKRGLRELGRVTVWSEFPLGLFYAWSYVDSNLAALVYPSPSDDPSIAHGSGEGRGDQATAGPGMDDFFGLRPYVPGDPPRHVAWKALTRGDTLLVKMFNGHADQVLNFDWQALDPRMEVEMRLSQLCRGILDAEASGNLYSLTLPGQTLGPAQGQAHLSHCLDALALMDPADE